MAEAGHDGLDDGHRRRGGAPAGQRILRLSGAVVSLALVVGMGVWGYRLAVRDVQGVPVIQALDGPMRIAPADPGGEIADHQGLAVNDVAAAGVATPLPERLILAPRPVELADEDTAGLAGLPPLGTALAALPAAPVTGADLALAAAPPVESASPTEIAVDAALAEALGLAPEDIAAASAVGAGVADAIEATGAPPAPLGPELAAVPPLPDDPVADDPVADAGPGAITVSPRPRPRPGSARADVPASAAADVADLASAAPAGIDPATIPVGTRLVQFGAFDTAELARAEWVRLSGSFGDLMAGRDMVVQPAESGGRTFWRLRAHGFDGEDDARRFCSAFVAQGATCIPVPQR